MLRADLCRRTPDEHLASLQLTSGDARIGLVEPAVRIARIQVVRVRIADDAFDRGRRIQPAIAAEEPEAILLDRPTVADARVIRLDDARRFADADGAQLEIGRA